MKKNNLRTVLTVIALILSFGVFAQTKVTGVVVDGSAGEPVIGATIMEVGTNNGTITDFDGNFEITVQNNATLQISYVGYKSQEVATAGKSNLKVILHEDTEQLDEVVVVGYGSVKKNDATGSVTAIKPDEMNKGMIVSAQDMLQGKIAGVQVTSGGGTPGGGATIRIRGGSSLNASNDPLIVIDGLAMDNEGIKGVSNPLAMVNPADIETFTVLKDASATAIYGSRASNGVIIITTKKGAQGSKPKFSYEGNASVSALTDKMQTLTGNELRAYATSLGHDASKTRYLGTENTNWQDHIYTIAPSTDHNFTVTGGTKHMPYRASLGYTYQDGVIKTSNMQRVTASVNLNPSFLQDHLKFNLNAKGMYVRNRYAANVVGAALSMDPTMPVYGGAKNANGEVLLSDQIANDLFGGYYQVPADANFGDPVWTTRPSTQSTANPVATLNNRKDIANSGCFVGNLEGDYKIHGFEDLHLHANFGADYSYGKQVTNENPTYSGSFYYGWNGWEWKTKYNLQFNCYAQYGHDWEEAQQHFDAMVGYEWQHFKNWGQHDGWGVLQPTNVDYSTTNPALNIRNRSKGTWGTENYLVSFFGRINWVGWNQVMLTATVRGDGSSRFSKQNRWGVFPSVALGWKIKETFLRDVNEISDLKLRLGYGITGQQNINQGDYPYMATYTQVIENAYYPIGAEGQFLALDADGQPIKDANGNPLYNHYRPGAYNPNLTWEKTTTYNAGIDYGFLNNRINGAFDFYYRDTKDLIQTVAVPAGTNFSNRVISNVGSLRNMGVEFAINAVIIDRKNFKWDMGYNVTWNDNKITSLLDNQGKVASESYKITTGGISSGTGNTIQVHKVGYAANSFYVFETSKETLEDGKTVYAFVDRNKDGQITDEDKYCYKQAAAPVSMGFQTKFQFYNFDLGITLRASIGNYVYNDVLASNLQWVQSDKICNAGYHGLLTNAYTTYWQDGFRSNGVVQKLWDKETGTYKVTSSNYADWFFSDRFVEDASFLRCDNITLGYSFNKNPKIHARIYATVSNPFVVTKYTGMDPEIFGGIDTNIYPRSMTTLVGVSLQF